MPLNIIRNDITLVAADAIVNTADPLPRVGAGTDRAVHEAAGPELLAARKKLGELAVAAARRRRLSGFRRSMCCIRCAPSGPGVGSRKPRCCAGRMTRR